MLDVCLCSGCGCVGSVGKEWVVAWNKVWKGGVVLCLWELWVGILCVDGRSRYQYIVLGGYQHILGVQSCSTLLISASYRVFVYGIYLKSRQGWDKREHRNICAVFSAASPHAHVVSPLMYTHFFLCSFLHVFPVWSLFTHRHVNLGLSYILADSLFRWIMPYRDFFLYLFCHSLHRTIFTGK